MAIRLADVADIPQILKIYGPYVENTAYSFEYTVPTAEAFTRRFQEITRQFPWLVWEENGTILGYAYGSAPFTRAAFGWCAEASVYLAPEARRKGIGRELYARLEQLLRQQGYQKVYALVTSENTGSVAFHEAVGYTQTAVLPECGWKFDRWHGLIWMEKSLNSVKIPKLPPVPFGSIRKNNKNFG